MKHPIIISGFPLVGKTYVFENQDKTPLPLLILIRLALAGQKILMEIR